MAQQPQLAIINEMLCSNFKFTYLYTYHAFGVEMIRVISCIH